MKCFFFSQIKGWCNVIYKTLDLFSYPDHVSKMGNYAFKPIIVAVSIIFSLPGIYSIYSKLHNIEIAVQMHFSLL